MLNKTAADVIGFMARKDYQRLDRSVNLPNVSSALMSDDDITQVVKATAPAGTGKRFVRLRVTRL